MDSQAGGLSIEFEAGFHALHDPTLPPRSRLLSRAKVDKTQLAVA